MRVASLGYAVLLLAACGPLDDCREDPCVAESCTSPRDDEARVALECDMDEREPNGDLPFATPAPEGVRCRTTDTTTLEGRIGGDGDVDVYYSGVCALGPTVTVDVLDEAGRDPDLQVCSYFICEHGSTNVFRCYENEPTDACLDSSNPDIFPSMTDADAANGTGFRGCCRTGFGRITAEVECGALISQEVDTYIWVQPSKDRDPDECGSYRIAYRID